MLLRWTPQALLGLLILGVEASPGYTHYPHYSLSSEASNPETHKNVYPTDITVIDTTTVVSSDIKTTTHHVETTAPPYVNHTITSTHTQIVNTSSTEFVVTTIRSTVYATETDFATVTDTDTTTTTVPATITDLQTTTATVPATITTLATITMFSTTYDPCPTTCSLSVDTVSLFFWPTDRPYTYFSTYVETNLDYTFTSPSVYMRIPTAVGTNSLGRVGPSTADWILPLDLSEVSTIEGTVTRQLSLSDLGTDCPQTAEPSAIATMVDPRCNPILAAPPQVSSWASPCNACGRLGLFDPPYAVPTLTGGLVESTTTPEPVQVTTAPVQTSPPVETATSTLTSSVGESDEASDTAASSTPTATSDTLPSSAVGSSEVSATTTGDTLPSSAVGSSEVSAPTTGDTLPSSAVGSSEASAPTTSDIATGSVTSGEASITATAEPSLSASASLLPTSVVTASAAKLSGGLGWLVSNILAIALFL